MRYIIYGAGAIGGLIGGRLFQHHQEVVLIARGAQLEAIRERGLTLKSPDETKTLKIPVVEHPRVIEFRDDDIVFLTMKSQDTCAALEDLAMVAGSRIPVVCAQNGVENERLALRRFASVYGMMVVAPSTHLDPGIVEAYSTPCNGILDMGCHPRGVDAIANAVSADLSNAGFSTRVDADIMSWKHGKLLNNLFITFQAICGPGGDAADLRTRVRDEAVACYRAAGINYASEEEMNNRQLGIIDFGSGRRPPASSWQSLERRAGSIETDFFNGEIVYLGRLYGVPTPVNRVLQEISNRLARERQAPGSVKIEEIRHELAELESTRDARPQVV